MKHLSSKIHLLLIILSVSGPLKAASEIAGATQSEVVDYVNKNIEKTIIPLSNTESSAIDWELKRIRFRVQSQFGIKIPWITSFQVVPEVEFIIER